MNNIELSFKSIDNSTNKDDKDWTILSIWVTSQKSDIDLGCKYWLYRTVAYLDRNNKTYQTGSLFVPINNFKNIWFFICLNFSRKTFGHFVDSKYPNQSRISLINSIDVPKSDNLLFEKNAKSRISQRIITIPIEKFKFYVEEELEVL